MESYILERPGKPPEPVRRHARMPHYALWQLRDYALERGFPTLIVAGLFGFLGAIPIRSMMHRELAIIPRAAIAQYGSAQAARDALVAEGSQLFLRQSLGAIVFLGALFAMNGLVSNDRRLGHYRFLFAKPVAPPRYYGQAFVLHLAGFLAAVVVLALAWGWFIHPVLSVPLLVVMGMVYLCYAGIGFFLTAAARWDWLSLVAVSLFATLAWDHFGQSTSPAARLLYLLPPLPRVDSIYAALTQGTPLPWHTMWWLAGYGVAAFLAGLVVLRHRRLAIP